jgi:hypothetical protein
MDRGDISANGDWNDPYRSDPYHKAFEAKEEGYCPIGKSRLHPLKKEAAAKEWR